MATKNAVIAPPCHARAPGSALNIQQKIQAIRRYRELTGGSLLEAKNAVEAMT